MKQGLIAAALVVAILSAAASAMESDNMIASWENTMDHFTNFATNDGFDSLTLTSLEGVTDGSYALELDLQPGWRQGLTSAGGVDNLDWGADWIMHQLNGTTKFLLDVTTSNSLINIPMSSGLIIDISMQGDTGTSGWWGCFAGGGLVSAAYSADVTTSTIEFDLTKDANGDPQAIPPTYTAGMGWFQMRINTNVLAGGTNPGIVYFDNLRTYGHDCPSVPGDFNDDGTVDQADYTTWADNYGWIGMPPDNPLADERGLVPWPGNDRVDQADYTRWADNFSVGYPMPEPATLALLAIGAAILRRRAGAR